MSSILQSPTTASGRFGPYGGRYVPETLMVPLFELERAYDAARSDAAFQARLQDLLKNFAGRPTPLQFASRLSEKLGGPRIYLKREDLLHTGAHKINNAIGQGLLAVKMGKPRILVLSASFTWARKTWRGKRSTWRACACWARRLWVLIPAAVP